MSHSAKLKTTSPYRPGNRLQRARRAKRLSRGDIAGRLNVETALIKKIDLWQTNELPEESARRLVREYAKLVGLNPADFEGYFPHPPTLESNDKQLVALSKTGFSLVAVSIGLLAMAFLGWRTYTATAAPNLDISFPPAGYETNQPSLTVEGRTSEQAQIFINGIVTPINPDGGFTQEVILSRGPNKLEITAVNSFGRERTDSRTVFYTLD